MLDDPTNYLPLKFSQPIVYELDTLRKLFQGDKLDSEKVHNDFALEFRRYGVRCW